MLGSGGAPEGLQAARAGVQSGVRIPGPPQPRPLAEERGSHHAAVSRRNAAGGRERRRRSDF